MNNEEEQRVWQFSTGEEAKQEEPEEKSGEPFLSKVVDQLRNYATPITAGSIVVLAISLIFVIAAGGGEPDNASYDIPGGDIKRISEDDVSTWVSITDQLARSVFPEKEMVLHTSSMISFRVEMKEREELKSVIQELCKQNDTSFKWYRRTTREIGLTNPASLLRRNPDEMRENVPEALKENRSLVRRNAREILDAWNRLQEISKSIKKTKESNTSNESRSSSGR